uniref:NADH dehydrogenase subunit 1 n=1 Tax=Cycetogamasus diviortus TaxID=2978624 RepID=UPI0022F30323|nr:NADH dehydrogenase subunit 1 [Cycetogamasus diviortus]WAK85133.1 NADH dehydrogenase subunit 1 [Cycetogamasus diviortus]
MGFYVILLICVLVSVAFITLLERKILGYIQVRKGPNKVGFMGVLQPFADAVKLFTKENNFLIWYNLMIYYMAPIFSLVLMLLFWLVFPWETQLGTSYDLMLVMVISSLGVYVILGAGWASNSKYALLGAYRGVAQTISYEVGFSFILLGVLVLSSSYGVLSVCFSQELMYFFFGLWNLFMLWLVTILAETNRTPFDFAEGESELVSGFNVEYGAGGFAILFMAEYGNIIFMSMISSCMFFGGVGFLCWKMMLVVIFYLWVRGTLARFRYDNLMMLAWKVVLPYSIFLLVFTTMFYMYMFEYCIIF